MSTNVKISKNLNMSILDNVELDETYEKNSTKIKLSLEYLVELKEVHRIVEDRQALKIALFFYKLAHSDNLKRCLTDEIDFLTLSDYFVHIFDYCSAQTVQFLAENEYLKMHAVHAKSLKIKYHFVSYLIDVVCFYTEVSSEFRVKFHEAKGTEVLLMKYLSNEPFIKDCLRLIEY